MIEQTCNLEEVQDRQIIHLKKLKAHNLAKPEAGTGVSDGRKQSMPSLLPMVRHTW